MQSGESHNNTAQPWGNHMPARRIDLTEHYDTFIEEQVSAGRFRDASEVMGAGLRLLEQQTREEREKLAMLRSLASEAFDQLDQGQGIQVNGQRQLATFIAQIGRRAARSVNVAWGRDSMRRDIFSSAVKRAGRKSAAHGYRLSSCASSQACTS
jgi:antitoxin ParD1/3/4